MRPSEAAWGGLAAAIAAYEYFAPDDELMTDQAHRLLKHERKVVRYATRAVIGVTALHLLGLMPRAIDPYVHLGKLTRNRHR